MEDEIVILPVISSFSALRELIRLNPQATHASALASPYGDLLLTWGDPEVYTLAVARGEITYEYWSTTGI
jgi:hypothetical protein